MTETTSTRNLILGTAGHIDHGKTALVHALSGVDTVRLPEERRRGMTIDIGFARLNLGEFELGIVDVPGHERFIRNMLAGASGNDLVMMIVAADDSVMPQTREHLEILKLLEVQRGLIAITKCDLVDETMIELVEEEVRDLVRSTFLEAAPVVQTSATTGQGIDALKSTLLEVCRQVHVGSAKSLFQLAVDRSFALRGQGTVVTGSMASGRLAVGDEVEWLPEAQTVRVRSLESHGRTVPSVQCGQRAAVGLGRVHHRQIMRGHVLATPGYLKATKLLSARLKVSASCPWPLKHRSRFRLHMGTGQTVASMSLLRGSALGKGDTEMVQLFLAKPMVARCGQPFVLRSISPMVTVGGGHVLQPLAKRLSRRGDGQFDKLDALASLDSAQRAEETIFSYETNPWSDLDLCRDANIQLEQVEDLLTQFHDAGAMTDLSIGHDRKLRVHTKVLSNLNAQILSALERYHERNPLHVSMPRHRLAHCIGLQGDEPLLAALLSQMAEVLSLNRDGVALTGFAPKLSPEQQMLYDQANSAFLAAGLQPPTLNEFAAKHGIAQSTARQIIDLAVAQDQLTHLGGGFYLHVTVEREMRRLIRQALQQADKGLTLSEIRQLLKTSRKYAVPFCEYLDRIGFTRRRVDLRVLGPAARSPDPNPRPRP